MRLRKTLSRYQSHNPLQHQQFSHHSRGQKSTERHQNRCPGTRCYCCSLLLSWTRFLHSQYTTIHYLLLIVFSAFDLWQSKVIIINRLTVCRTSNIFLIKAWISSRLDLKFSRVCNIGQINITVRLPVMADTHILNSNLKICHVGLAVLGYLVSLVIKRQPAVHKRLNLENIFV